MNYNPIEVILIGCGAVSQEYYTPALLELQKNSILKLKGIFDPDPLKIQKIKKKFPDVKTSEKFEEALNLKSELAIISSPPCFHKQQSIMAMETGKAVLCEKPMAVSVADCEEMISCSLKTKKLLAIGLVRRFFPSAQTIRQLLLNNLLGEIKSFHFYEGGLFKWPVQSPSFFSKEISGGGILIDIGIHLLDLLIWWWGQPVEIIYMDDSMGGVEANCLLKLKFSDGFSGTVRLSRDWDLPNYYLIEGSLGSLYWEVNEANKIYLNIKGIKYSLKCEIQKSGFNKINIPFSETAENFEQSFIFQILNIINALRNRSALMVPGEEGLRSVNLVNQCYQKRSFLQPLWFNENEIIRAQQYHKER
ncbi:MAG TPA: Gfo/Idh/MocA family oxidoreductase [Ignavibacteriaceae bacterium]|nr:Gfo/Idh/MocA family oxidoreductase [Ignavibacteriaceae bacterium]